MPPQRISNPLSSGEYHKKGYNQQNTSHLHNESVISYDHRGPPYKYNHHGELTVDDHMNNHMQY